MKHTFLFAVALVFALLVHDGVTAQWVSTTGIPGGQINCFQVATGATYAGTWGGGVYKSTDQGGHWTYSGLIGQKIRSMAIVGGNMFAGTHTGIWLSTDNGGTWTSVNGPNQVLLYAYVMQGAGPYLVAGGYNGISRTSDAGNTWTVDTTGLTNPAYPVADVRAIAGTGKDLYCGIPGFGVARSADSGHTWQRTPAQPSNNNIQAFAYNGGTVFAGTQGGVFVSTDHGASWNAFNNGLSNPDVLSLTLQGSTILAGTLGGGVFQSPVASNSWSEVNNGLGDKTVLALTVNVNLLAGTYGGVWSSPTSGISWTVKNTGLTATRVYALAANGSTLFAGAYGSGLFRSTDDGATWTNTGVANHYFHALLANGSAIYGGSEGGFYHSPDNGVTWNAAVSGLGVADNRDVRGIALNGTTLYAGTLDGVWTSTDGGANWTETGTTGLTNTDVWGIAYSGSKLFAGTQGSGVFASTDGGATWNLSSNGISGPEAYFVNTMKSSGNTIFAGTGTGLWESTNGGTNWYDITGNPGNGDLGSNFILSLVPKGTSLIVGVRNGGGVFFSSSFGPPYTNVGDAAGLLSTWVSSLAINSTELYAGISGAGVWRRPLSGPLPIQLASFDAATLSKSSVKLSWETLSEINNYGFEVQKAAGTSGTFASIAGAFIPGNGTTTVKHDYSYTDNAYVTGNVYRLEQIDLTGTAHYTDVVDPLGVTSAASTPLPKEFSLSQNYPNPFNPSTVIEFALPKDANVNLVVYNMIGQKVMTLVDGLTPAGYHSVKLDGTNLASGMYLYRLTTGKQTIIKKTLLMK